MGKDQLLFREAKVWTVARTSSATLAQAALERAEGASLLLLSHGDVQLRQPMAPAGFYFTVIFLMARVARRLGQ